VIPSGARTGADGDLHALDGIGHQQAESPVERVPPPYRFESSAFAECVTSRDAERVPVATEAVVTGAPESVDQLVPIGHKAAAKELVGLLLKGKGGLGVLHQPSLPT
jgi:hypothetical protein